MPSKSANRASIPAATPLFSITAVRHWAQRLFSSRKWASCHQTICGVAGTVAAVERELLRDGFVLRYRTDEIDDGLGCDEGAFLACSFWLADAYVMLNS
jgi:hypothetical protein